MPPQLRSLPVPPQCANRASVETGGATRGEGNEVLTWVASLRAHAYMRMQAQTTPLPSLLMRGEGSWTGFPRLPPVPTGPRLHLPAHREPHGRRGGPFSFSPASPLAGCP